MKTRNFLFLGAAALSLTALTAHAAGLDGKANVNTDTNIGTDMNTPMDDTGVRNQIEPRAGADMDADADINNRGARMDTEDDFDRSADITSETDAQAGATVTADALSSNDIRRLQRRLSDQGLSLQVDGVWGPNTEQAIRSFQRQNDLAATGELNARTLSMLDVDIESMNNQ